MVFEAEWTFFFGPLFRGIVASEQVLQGQCRSMQEHCTNISSLPTNYLVHARRMPSEPQALTSIALNYAFQSSQSNPANPSITPPTTGAIVAIIGAAPPPELCVATPLEEADEPEESSDSELDDVPVCVACEDPDPPALLVEPPATDIEAVLSAGTALEAEPAGAAEAVAASVSGTAEPAVQDEGPPLLKPWLGSPTQQVMLP